MAGNTPDPALAARTQPATFGQIDAFLTHSWSDNSTLKWQQLQQWRAAFKAKHNGREPLMWIDKVVRQPLCLPFLLDPFSSRLFPHHNRIVLYRPERHRIVATMLTSILSKLQATADMRG